MACVCQSVPLVLDMEYPALLVEPVALDFGFITDGDTRKTYFSVKHTSRESNTSLLYLIFLLSYKG